MKYENVNGLISRLVYRVLLGMRWIGPKPVCRSFGNSTNARCDVISRICVINLDRQVPRWQQIQRELRMVCDKKKQPLVKLSDRFSAVDARRFTGKPSHPDLEATYTLSDQLYVEPNPLLATNGTSEDREVEMTRQEIAVAMSHIEVWKQIASSDHSYTLVLEDDVFFCRGFAGFVDQAWTELVQSYGPTNAFDIFYLSHKESKSGVEKHDVSKLLFRPIRGLWYLSGYVLSSKGAKALISLLPVRGPVDLWMNLQFGKLDVFATSKSIIDQRDDGGSDNAYSILPVLSSVGVLSDVNPSVFAGQRLPKPVFVVGKPRCGLTSLAMTLSMLGYRCCSDVAKLPPAEHDYLFSNDKRRLFDAYCNVGSLSSNRLVELAALYKDARFIIATDNAVDAGDTVRALGYASLSSITNKLLVLNTFEDRKWDCLAKFLGCNIPICDFPVLDDREQRRIVNEVDFTGDTNRLHQLLLEADESPWNIPMRGDWHGIRAENTNGRKCRDDDSFKIDEDFRYLDETRWRLLTETFPSNLALFAPKNFTPQTELSAKLTLQKESVGVREFTSASIASRQSFRYGRFSVELRPVAVPGVVTGVFLHRNSPRQEIDIEFLGNDTSKLLANVYYNPGTEGSRFDYGYRGSPVLIDLGFDASKMVHSYAMEWTDTSIRWLVDDRLVHERVNWYPTPIPHLPMQFYLNLWPTKSEELAGKLHEAALPTFCEIKSVHIKS